MIKNGKSCGMKLNLFKLVIKMKLIRICITVLFFSLTVTKLANAEEQQLAAYQVSNLNINSQAANIVDMINQIKPNKVIIYYSGAMYFLANEVSVSIQQQTPISIELDALNGYYFNNGTVTVVLVGDVTVNQSDNAEESGNFFNYTTPNHGFFSNDN